MKVIIKKAAVEDAKAVAGLAIQNGQRNKVVQNLPVTVSWLMKVV